MTTDQLAQLNDWNHALFFPTGRAAVAACVAADLIWQNVSLRRYLGSSTPTRVGEEVISTYRFEFQFGRFVTVDMVGVVQAKSDGRSPIIWQPDEVVLEEWEETMAHIRVQVAVVKGNQVLEFTPQHRSQPSPVSGYKEVIVSVD